MIGRRSFLATIFVPPLPKKARDKGGREIIVTHKSGVFCLQAMARGDFIVQQLSSRTRTIHTLSLSLALSLSREAPKCLPLVWVIVILGLRVKDHKSKVSLCYSHVPLFFC